MTQLNDAVSSIKPCTVSLGMAASAGDNAAAVRPSCTLCRPRPCGTHAQPYCGLCGHGESRAALCILKALCWASWVLSRHMAAQKDGQVLGQAARSGIDTLCTNCGHGSCLW